jgi:quercetin dioxygenase-like cupin family protein
MNMVPSQGRNTTDPGLDGYTTCFCCLTVTVSTSLSQLIDIATMPTINRLSFLQHGYHGTALTLFLATLLVLGGCADASDSDNASSAETEPASDLAALNSEYASTPHETAYAHAHRVDLPAGASIAPHEGGARVIYSLSPYTIRFETNGTASEQTFAAGDLHYHESGVHTVDNTGDQPAQFMAFERIDAPLPDTASTGETLDAVSIPDGATHEVPLENDRVTVHRITLEPGASLPTHYGYPRIVYALADYTLTYIDPDTDARTERSFTEGDLHDHDPGLHTVENTGDERAEYIVVAFKQ